jgi:hypothetical protein
VACYACPSFEFSAERDAPAIDAPKLNTCLDAFGSEAGHSALDAVAFSLSAGERDLRSLAAAGTKNISVHRTRDRRIGGLLTKIIETFAL